MKIIFKSSLGITLAALIALSTPSQANEDDEIDCENAETTYEISVCAAKEADLKKAEVNKIIASLPDSAVLSKAVISKLILQTDQCVRLMQAVLKAMKLLIWHRL